MADLERVRAALEGILGVSVKTFLRAAWDGRLRTGGQPTRLPEPFEPHRGVQTNPDFMFAVASGTPFAAVPGVHHVRKDLKDDPNVINIDSLDVIVDLVADPRWLEVLVGAGLEESDGLVALVRDHVFAYPKNRDDHHSPTVPEDIDGAEPK